MYPLMAVEGWKMNEHMEPHTPDDKLILPAVSEDVHTVLHKLEMDMIKKIPSSNKYYSATLN
ncbi:hypothetical protein T06_12595 [Trichinella sp. T6]|nr:hypothetical protein T06_12595 [Trichinella sp. T6]